MRLKFACLFIALAACGMQAHAEIVRCTGPDGKVSYVDVACPTSTTNITAVHTDMASPGEQLDNFDGTQTNVVRAPRSPASSASIKQTRTIVVRHVIVVRPAEYPHVPEKAAPAAAPQAPAAAPQAPATAPHAQAHAAAGHK